MRSLLTIQDQPLSSQPGLPTNCWGQNHLSFANCSMDLIMDLPPINGYDSILVMVDQGLSKGVILFPCVKTITWEDIAELLWDNLFKRFGLPDRIISNRDPWFTARAFQELLKLLNVTSSLSTAYHPQTDRVTERVNQEIKAYLSIYCTAHPEKWLKSLSTLEFTHNNRRHADWTHTPFELILGDNLIAVPLTFTHTKYPIIEEKMKWLLHEGEEALAAHKLARTRMANWKQSKFTPFERGQKVWLNTPNFKTGHYKKIAPKREGPFEIKETLGPVTYWLKLPESWKIHNVFHATLLQPYIENEIYGNNYPRPPSELLEGEEVYEVETILKQEGDINTISNGKDIWLQKPPGKMNWHFLMIGIWWNNINSGISSNTIVFLKQHALHKIFPIYAQPQNKRILDQIKWTNPQTPGSTTGTRIGRDVPWIRVYEQSHKNSTISFLNQHHWRNPLELSCQWLIINNMPSTYSSFIPKKEFTKVITDSDFTSTPTPHSREFYSILTKPPSLTLKLLFPLFYTPTSLNIMTKMFPTLELYKNFMDRWLGIWEHDLQVKYFDSLYCHQWATTNSIKILCDQVQKLLEEANQLQERKHSLRREINHHLHTITQPKLCRHLYNPYKVQPWPTIPTVRPTQPISSTSRPTLHSNPNPKKQTVFWCFQCDSLTHIKWNCPQYHCWYCKDVAPGHLQQNCPKKRIWTLWWQTLWTLRYQRRRRWKSEWGMLKTQGKRHVLISLNKNKISFYAPFLFISLFLLYIVPFSLWTFLPLIQTFLFYSPMSIFTLLPIQPFRRTVSHIPYHPPILTKHYTWYFNDADFFISIHGILFGLHHAYFSQSHYFQSIMDVAEPEWPVPRGSQALYPIPFNDLN